MTMTLQSTREAEQYLLQYSPPNVSSGSYKLDRMIELMDRLDNPQNSLRVIHIAGTSGKTSTSYFIRNLLEASGKKTGLTVSPHIETIAERVQIGGKPLPETVFLVYLNEFLILLRAWPELEPTYFEILIAFAYWVFAKERVDYAVIETGLGGLKDATNVVTRTDKVCVLTAIGLDHTNVLGSTIEQIASQKAGIIGHGNKVFSAPQPLSVQTIFNEATQSQSGDIEYIKLREKQEQAMPLFQQHNWQLASRIYDYVQVRDELPLLTDDAKQEAYTPPPGRYERYTVGDKVIILDGAHNPQKLQALHEAIRNETKENVSVLAGFIAAPDTKIESCLAELEQFAHHIILTEFSVSQDIKARRSVQLTELSKFLNQKNMTAELVDEPEQALAELLRRQEDVLIITGSLYLIALLRPVIRKLARE